MKCPNCQRPLRSCGCDTRIASDGTVVCIYCIHACERKLLEIKQNAQHPVPIPHNNG